MANTVGAASIELSVDSTGVETGLARAETAVTRTGRTIQTFGTNGAAAIESVGTGANGAASRVDAATRSMIGNIQRTTATMEAGSRSSRAYFEALANQRGVNVNALRPYLDQLDSVAARQRVATAAVDASNPALARVGVSAAQTANALRGVPAQFTDIVTSLQGGQAPLTVFLQQGGQLRDMFGSTGGAARALGGYIAGLINPFTVAAAAGIALAGAYYQGSKEASGYERAIVLTGNAVGVTSGQIADMARNIDAVVGTQAKAAETLAAMAQSGQVAGDNLERFSRVAIEMERTVGKSVEDTVTDLAALGKAPLEASKKLSEQYRYLTAATYDQIRALTEQGRAEEAAATAQQAYIDAFEERSKKLEGRLGIIERSWRAVKDAASETWDTIMGIGREETVGDKLARASNVLTNKQSGLAQRAAAGKGDDRISQQLRADIADAQAYKKELEGQADAAKRLIAIETGKQELDKAAIDWKEQGNKLLTKEQQLEKEIAETRRKGLAAGVSDKEINDRVAAIQKRAAGTASKSTDGVDAQIEMVRRRGAVEDAVAQRSRMLLESNKAAGLVVEEQYIQAVEALEVGAFAREKARLQEELRLAAGKPNSLKEQAALRGQIEAVEANIVTRRLQTENQLNEMEVKRNRTAAENYANVVDRAMAERDTITGQLAAQQDYNAAIGKTAEEVAALASARLLERAETAEQNAAIADGLDLSGQMSAIYRQQAEELRALAGAQVQATEKQRIAQGLKEVDSYLDPTRAQEFGDALRNAFGGAGDAIVQMTGALSDFGRKQAEISKHRASTEEAFKKGTIKEVEYSEKIAGLNKKDTESRLRGYGDMAGAAAGFFNEQSRGYQVLQAVSQAFHAAELAATVAELVPKGISAVLNQASGDPYSAIPRMAAMAAIVAGLGVAIGGIGGSGGGGGKTAAEMQKEQGSGSVFGDAKAQSDSIAASLESLEQNSGSLIPINRGMLDALRAIEASMAGLTNLVVRVPGLTEGTNMGITEGQTGLTKMPGHFMSVGPLEIGAKLWGKTSQTIVDAGLQFSGAVRDLQKGVGFEQYASVDTTKKSWFGLSKKTSNRVEATGLDADLSAQFGLVFQNVETALEAAATGLGIGADHVNKVLDSLSIDMTKVSLKGLSGQELTDAISTVISKATDDMAAAVFPELDSFRKVGEGYAQTVIRLASEYGQLDVALASIGKQFGAVGVQSLAARQNLIEMVGGIDTFVEQTSSFADSFLTEAERLAPVQKYVVEQMAAMGLATVTTKDQFKALVQGLDLSTAAGAKQYAQLMSVADGFAAVFDAAAEAAKARGDLEGQIYDLTHTASEATIRQRQAELAAMESSLRPLQERIYALQDEQAALEAAKTTAAGLISNADTAFGVLQQIVNRQKTALQEQHAAELKAIEKRITVQNEALVKAKSLADSIKSTMSQLEVPGQEAAGRKAAQADIRAALATARAGGPLPDADSLKDALSAITQDASDQFSSYTDYLRDFYATANDVAGLGDLADSSLTVAEKTLAALEKQKDASDAAYERQIAGLDLIVSTAQEEINVLKGMDNTLLTIAQGQDAVALAIAGIKGNSLASATGAITQAYQIALGRNPDAAGLEYWRSVAAGGASLDSIADSIKGSPEAQVRALYKEVLGRVGDAAGVAFFTDRLKKGVSLAEVRQDMLASDEYKKLHPFAVGTNYVPKTMPALVHEGERIIPAADNRALMAMLSQPGRDDSALVAEIRSLRAEVAELRKPMQQAADGATGTRDLIDKVSAGGNAFAVEDFTQ